jgi:hypothetical protein
MPPDAYPRDLIAAGVIILPHRWRLPRACRSPSCVPRLISRSPTNPFTPRILHLHPQRLRTLLHLARPRMAAYGAVLAARAEAPLSRGTGTNRVCFFSSPPLVSLLMLCAYSLAVGGYSRTGSTPSACSPLFLHRRVLHASFGQQR